MRRPAILLCLALLPGTAAPWGDDGHKLILREAIRTLPPDVRRFYDGKGRELDRLVVEPDHRSQVPAEGCKHWVNVEKTEAAYVDRLSAALVAEYGEEDYADEDARGVAAGIDKGLFGATPPPWNAARVEPLWKGFPPTLGEYRRRFGRLEIFIGTVVYQPVLYTRALARAIARGDKKRALAYAGYLAHYAGDLHVPVHVTSNYKGQYTGHLTFDDRERGDAHCRFETGYLKADLAEVARAVRARRGAPVVVPAGRITPLALRAASDAYVLAPKLFEIDRAATAKADPRRDWDAWVAAATPGYRTMAAAQLAMAADFLSSLLMSAAKGEDLLVAPPGSSKMGSPP